MFKTTETNQIVPHSRTFPFGLHACFSKKGKNSSHRAKSPSPSMEAAAGLYFYRSAYFHRLYYRHSINRMKYCFVYFKHFRFEIITGSQETKVYRQISNSPPSYHS